MHAHLELEPTVAPGKTVRKVKREHKKSIGDAYDDANGVITGHLIACTGSIPEGRLELRAPGESRAVLVQRALISERRALGEEH